MVTLTAVFHTLLMVSAGLSAVLVALIIYGNVLDSRADEEIYLNKTAESMLGGGQAAIAGEMHRLARAIVALAVVTGIALFASAAIWVYLGLFQ